jgi:hypothetical protein
MYRRLNCIGARKISSLKHGQQFLYLCKCTSTYGGLEVLYLGRARFEHSLLIFNLWLLRPDLAQIMFPPTRRYPQNSTCILYNVQFVHGYPSLMLGPSPSQIMFPPTRRYPQNSTCILYNVQFVHGYPSLILSKRTRNISPINYPSKFSFATTTFKFVFVSSTYRFLFVCNCFTLGFDNITF